MAVNDEIRVVEAQRMDEGVIVTFSDGLCAIYPASLLHASIGLARVMSDRDCEEDESDAAERKAAEAGSPQGLADDAKEV